VVTPERLYEVIEQYRPGLLRVARDQGLTHEEAKDLLADVYVKLVQPQCPQQRCTTTGDRGTVCPKHKEWLRVALDYVEDTNLKSWLATRIKYDAMDARKARATRAKHEGSHPDEVADAPWRAIQRATIDKVIAALSDDEQELYRRVFVHRARLDDVAKEWGVSASTIDRQVTALRDKLRPALAHLRAAPGSDAEGRRRPAQRTGARPGADDARTAAPADRTVTASRERLLGAR
jgi:DNA-directed RNA polymerase specialized sigma24 family protein